MHLMHASFTETYYSKGCKRFSLQLRSLAVQVADSIGLPVDEGLFGFKPFPEVCSSLLSRTLSTHSYNFLLVHAALRTSCIATAVSSACFACLAASMAVICLHFS